MKGIELCADCAYYSMKTHKCTRGCTGDDGHFFVGCPLPEVQEIRHGRWIEVSPNHSRCSVCDTTCLIAVYPISKGANYCPNCGARMDEQEVEEDA